MEKPLDGLAGLRQNWSSDLLAGFLVFLIALPLCLGISLASGVPPLSGIIAAVVGGVVVSLLSGSYVTINGPAAGLIVVILGAVQSLTVNNDPFTGYTATLAAIALAGLIQMGLGLSKAGRFHCFFPASAVHGLLASIGIIIMAKQSYTLLGLKAQGSTALANIVQLPGQLLQLNPEITLIGLVSLALLIVVPRLPGCRSLPAPLLAVLVGLGLGNYFDLLHEHSYLIPHGHPYSIGPKFLVTLPGNLLDGIVHPDWSRLSEGIFWKAVAMIAVIATLETLLSASAVDKLDPYQRKAELNRDLTAIGVGTFVSGMLGGLPMIAEIVRSSANINNGAKTRWANFFHGLCMLLFVALAPGLIHRIPLASLAAVLCYTGFRLASPKEFKRTYELGSDQLLVFVTTILVTLASDLLIGIFSGVAAKFVLHLSRGVRPSQFFQCQLEVQAQEQQVTCQAGGALTFANLIMLKDRLEALPQGRSLDIDLRGTILVDHSSLEYLHHFQHDYAQSGGSVRLLGLELHRSQSKHPLAARVLPA